VGKFLFKRSGRTGEQPAIDEQKPEGMAKKQLSPIDKLSLRLFEKKMRSFELDVRYVEKMKNPAAKAEAGLLLIENARLLAGDYRYDQREEQADVAYERALFKREDLLEYYADRRDRLAASLGRRGIVLNAVALGVIAVRKGRDAGLTLGIANGLAVAEFVIRSGRLDRRQGQAESGWKRVLEYAQNEKAAEVIPQAVKMTVTAGQKAEKQRDDWARGPDTRLEYAD
jgi:hypothetical protein